jgi:hypothetical protein
VALSLQASPRLGLGWRGRRGWLIAASLVVVVAVAIVSDLPTHTTGTYRQKDLASYVAADNAQIAQCGAGTHDALLGYLRSTAPRPTVSRSLVTTFVNQAISVCSFADAGVVDLGSAFPDRVIASPVVDGIAPALDAWAYLDAFDLLQDLKVAVADPGDAAVRAKVVGDVAAADRQRRRVEALVEAAERQVGAPARPLPLVALAPLMPGGGGAA